MDDHRISDLDHTAHGTPQGMTPTTDTKPPRCAMCRARTILAAVAARPEGGEQHTYHCAKCGYTKLKAVGGPDTGRRRPPKKTRA